jgi:hypothetical protein
MWIIPFNGKKVNDIQERRPGILEIFLEIEKDGNFPKNIRINGNSY